MNALVSLEEGFRLYRANWEKALGGMLIYWFLETFASALFILPFLAALFSFLFSGFSMNPLIALLFGISFLMFIAYIALTGFLVGGYIKFCSTLIEKPAELSTLLDPPRKTSLLLAPFLQAVPPLLIGLVIIIIGYLTFQQLSPDIFLTVMVLLLLFLLGLLIIALVSMFFAFTIYSIVLEDKGVIGGFLASMHFVAGNFLDSLILFILITIISAGVSMIFAPLYLVPFGGMFASILSWIAQILLMPWLLISLLLFYQPKKLKGKVV